MNTIKLFLLFVFCLICEIINGQSQQCYVKTLGRPDKKGEPLSGVLVRVYGEHNPALSKENGTLSLYLTAKKNGDAFTLQEVQKKGYELNDNAVIGRQFAYSDKVPLTIVMVSSAQLQAEKRRIENNAFLVAEKNYKEKIALLEKQKLDNTISEEQFRIDLLELQNKLEKYQLLIDGLAEHYSHVDYDYINDTERKINIYIENGELEQADSLIHSVFNPVGVVQRNKEALAHLNQQISEANILIDNANEDMIAVLKQQEKDANYLYHLFTISLSRFDFDAAQEYITTRADLDSTNVQWGLDAAHFLAANIGDLTNAKRYAEQALYQSLLQYGELHELTISCYDGLFMYDDTNRLPNAQRALDLSIKLYGDNNHIATASRYNNLGLAYLSADSLDLAFTHIQKSIDLYLEEDPYNKNLSSSYTNIGGLYAARHEYDMALKYLYKSMSLREQQNDLNIYSTYQSIAAIYAKTEQYDSALVYYSKALEIGHKVFGKHHPSIAGTYSGISYVFFELGEYAKSQDSLENALESLIIPEVLTDFNRSLELADTYDSIALIYRTRQEFIQAINYFKKALDIREKFLDEKNEDYLQSYLDIGNCYYLMGDYEQSLTYLKERLRILKSHPTLDISLIFLTYNNIARVYIDSHELKNAQWFIEESLSICMNHDIKIDNKYVCLCNAGDYYASMGDYKTALIYFEDAFNMYDSVNVPSKQSLCPTIAKVYASLEEWDNAILYYKKELLLESRDSIACAELLYHIGKCYFYKGEEEDALEFLLSSVDVFNKISIQNELLADACNLIAIIYVHIDLPQEAKKYGLNAIRLGQHESIYDNPELADYYYNTGLISAQLEEYADAIEYFSTAKLYYEQLYREASTNYVETLQNLVSVYFCTGKESEAISQLSNTLKTFLSLMEDNPDSIIQSVQRLEEIIVANYKNSDNIVEYESMLTLIFKAFQNINNDKYQPHIILVMNDLGNFYYDQKRYDESIKMYSNILNLSTDTYQIALITINLANIYLDMNNYSECERLYKLALTNLYAVDSINSIDRNNYIATCLIRLGYTCFLTERYGEELDYYLKAEIIMEQTHSPNLGSLYDDISRCYKEMGNHSKAAEYIKKSFYFLIKK